MTALFALVPRWVYAALIAMLAATSCKFKLDKDGLLCSASRWRRHPPTETYRGVHFHAFK